MNIAEIDSQAEQRFATDVSTRQERSSSWCDDKSAVAKADSGSPPRKSGIASPDPPTERL
jgi:hypothetical protein